MGRRSHRMVVVVLVAAFATSFGTIRPAVGAAPPERFVDPVFTDVTVTHDLVYKTAPDHLGRDVELKLDLYEPVGDPAERRPLLLWLHGGGFTRGSRTQGRSVEMSTEYARRGFVVAAVDYRVNPTVSGDLTTIFSDQEFLDTILAAKDDARDAVIWLRAHADDHRTDPRAVVPAGYSAGAVLSLMLAYFPNRLLPGWATDPGRVGAGISVAGTMLGLLVEAGDPPAYMANGDRDTRVPYSSARGFCDAIIGIGQRCDFFTMPATGHDPSAFHETIREDSSRFVFEEVLAPLGYSAAPIPGPTTTTTTTTTTTSTSTTITTATTSPARSDPSGPVPTVAPTASEPGPAPSTRRAVAVVAATPAVAVVARPSLAG